MKRRRSSLLLVFCCPVIALGFGACASAPPTPRFPTAQTLVEMAAAPVASPSEAPPVADVAEWKLTGPFPGVVEAPPAKPSAPASPWEGLLTGAIEGRPEPLQPTAAAACAAREIGLFRAAQPGAPSPALVQFIAARCGVTAPDLLSGCQVSAAGDGVPDDRVFASDAPSVRAALATAAERAGAGDLEVGIWAGRKETHPLICWALAPRRIKLTRATVVPDADGHVVIEGELLQGGAEVEAVVTIGRLGTRPCRMALERQPPDLMLTCPVDRADAAAWIDVTTTDAEQIGGSRALSLLAWPSGTADDSYHRSGADTAMAPPVCTAPAGASIGDAVTACINQARELAGAKPLSVAAAQGQTVAAAVSRLAAAARGLESLSVAEKLSLGLRAGWDTQADLLFGQLAFAAEAGAPVPTSMVAALLEHPAARAALLDRKASLLAVGASAPPGAGFTAVAAATYRVADGQLANRQADIDEVWQRINDIRVARGKKPLVVFADPSTKVLAEAEQLTQGRHTVTRAISDAAEAGVGNMKFGHVHGWTRQTDHLGAMWLPDPLLSVSEAAVGVARYRPPGEPWLRFVVLIVGLHDGSDNLGPDTGVVFMPTIYTPGK